MALSFLIDWRDSLFSYIVGLILVLRLFLLCDTVILIMIFLLIQMLQLPFVHTAFPSCAPENKKTVFRPYPYQYVPIPRPLYPFFSMRRKKPYHHPMVRLLISAILSFTTYDS